MIVTPNPLGAILSVPAVNRWCAACRGKTAHVFGGEIGMPASSLVCQRCGSLKFAPLVPREDPADPLYELLR